MKKIILGAIAVVAISFSSMAQDMENRARHKAEAASRDCARDLGLPNGYELHSSAEPYMACDYRTGNPNQLGYVVQVWATPNCPPNMLCIQIVYPVATVYVDCGGEVVEVICSSSDI